MFYLDVDLNEFIYYFSFVFVGDEIFVLVIFLLFCVDKWQLLLYVLMLDFLFLNVKNFLFCSCDKYFLWFKKQLKYIIYNSSYKY